MTSSASISRIDDLDTLFQAGEAFFHQNDIERAKSCFKKVLDRDPTHCEAINNLGVISFYQGDSAGAWKLFETALSINPAYREALINLAQLPGVPPQSIVPFVERALGSFPDDPELATLLDTLSPASREAGLGPVAEHERTPAFFVFSAGRSGAETIERILGLSADVALYRDQDPEALKATLSALDKGIDAIAAFRKLRSQPLLSARERGLVHGEVTPLLSRFAAAIARELPASKFIVLVRNPYDFVRSALARNCYQGHPDDALRPVPSPGSPFYTGWRERSQIEKICWLWAHTYGTLLDVLGPLPDERRRIVRVEDLDSHAAIEELFAFLAIGGYDAAEVGRILGLRLNAQNYKHFPEPGSWSDPVRNLVASVCGDVARRLGYDPSPAPVPKAIPLRASRPAVSVGFPLYSGGAMLADSLECFLAQDFGDFEIIVSDHGSDPMVREVADHYARLDPRIRYCGTEDRMRCIGAPNYVRVIELSQAPFFMWGSYDDRIEPAYIGRCVERLRSDDSVVLAYTKSKAFQNRRFIGPGNDVLHADMDDPCQRFVNVIRELAMCNAFYGLFRREVLRKTRAFRKDAYAHDNLLLAEIALAGKIVQVDEPLFVRDLTRNYDRSYEEHHTDMIRSGDAPWLEAGITLPFCRLTYSHLELVNYSALPVDKKESLTAEIVHCFKTRWDQQLRYEITRAVQLVNAGCFYCTWDGRHYGPDLGEHAANLRRFHAADVSKTLAEALFLYPEREDLRAAYVKTLGATAAFSGLKDPLSGETYASVPDLQP